MTQEELRQRIQYLVRFGGVIPEEVPPWRPWALVLVGLTLVDIAVGLLFR